MGSIKRMNQRIANEGCHFYLKVESSSLTADDQGWTPDLSCLLQVGHVFAFVSGWNSNMDILAQLFSSILAASVQRVELSVKMCSFQSQLE